jgi:hypothetical protein
VHVLGFLAAFLMPCTAHMSLEFPYWQTMYVTRGPLSPLIAPLSLVLMFWLAVLGYGVALDLLKRKFAYLAFMQFIGGYFLMFFGVMHGWDGTGYKRFLSVSAERLPNWSWSDASVWVNSDIAGAVGLWTIVMTPILLCFAAYWVRKDCPYPKSLWKIVFQLVVAVFGVAFGASLLCTLALIHLGVLWGAVLSLTVLLVVTQPRWGLLGRLHATIFVPPRISTTLTRDQ